MILTILGTVLAVLLGLFFRTRRSKSAPHKALQNYPSDLVVVLDLDETLIHLRETHGRPPAILLRPGGIAFLRYCLVQYETYIYTAGEPEYAQPILQLLEQKVGQRFAGSYFRSNCRIERHLGHNFFFKDLKQIHRKMSKIVLIDDDATNFKDNPDNGIPVRAFMGDRNDETLESVKTLLIELATEDDVRSILREKFKLAKAFEVAEAIYSSPVKQWEHVAKCIESALL